MELIDISNVNGPVGWKRVRLSGVSGVWLKATEGRTYDDDTFVSNRKAANKALLRVGAYHFARPDHNPPEAEADHFCKVVGRLNKNDLRPVLDFEIPTSNTNMVMWARTFSHRVLRTLDVIPLFYSYQYLIEQMKSKQPIGSGLWLASYGINDGKRHAVRVPWPWKHYVAHQYTSKGRVWGVNGYVDRSYAPTLNGVLAFPKGGE